MLVHNGNNSLKRMKSTCGQWEVGDTRELQDSNYFLDNAYVDLFENEVHQPAETDVKPEPEDKAIDGDEGYITEVDEPQLENCASNWKAAASTEKKRMWGVFDETGIFASACPHGFVLWLVDMVKSGELCIFLYLSILISLPTSSLGQSTHYLWYPKAMETLGLHLLIGYDIGCVFGGTILSTSLGAKFQESSSQMCINMFHGYSHNYKCQCKNHLNNITGMGLEDLETLERVFSSSNVVVAVTQLASAFQQRLYIEMHFKHWDEDKYANLATMLRNNYYQALDIIKTDGCAFEEAKRSLGVTDKDLELWKMEQEEYF